MAGIRTIGAEEMAGLLDPAGAARAIAEALRGPLDPETDPPRGVTGLRHGHLLLMPSEAGERAGVKIASVAPDNPRLGLPRIQALYLLLDARTLSPRLLLDGTALTTLRTPAVSAVALDRLAEPDASSLFVFGTGPQALGHIRAIAAIRPLERVTVAGRDPDRAAVLADRAEAAGLSVRLVQAGGAQARQALSSAELVVCATSAAEPILGSGLVAPRTAVCAVGSHEPDRRELDAALLARSLVVVEARSAALREAGDVVLAIAEGTLRPERLRTLSELVRGTVELDERPRVFKSVGMSWQDLAVAAAIERAAADAGLHSPAPPTRQGSVETERDQ
ncbi:MAG: ornithine cyclodeaminase family protein [Pseudoclavibacter sp.]|nr:ornithine cyclodeaminase family protein [Pseudoclavibacter sp.]